MKRNCLLLLIAPLLFSGCKFSLKAFEDDDKALVEVVRYDRLESQYLTTGDFSALQQMNTDYPMETRTLIEEVLRIGDVSDPKINKAFLTFYQDSTLQRLISDAELQYANMDDVNTGLCNAFARLRIFLPAVSVPDVYAQIGALDQSIVIGNNTIGICLDKYLGENYSLYKKYYDAEHRKTMTRDNIVPDCLNFYLLSLYPLSDSETRQQIDRDLHRGKMQWVCNLVLEKKFFDTRYVQIVDRYMAKYKSMPIESLLKNTDYREMKKEMNI